LIFDLRFAVADLVVVRYGNTKTSKEYSKGFNHEEGKS
jgi:hypothetical protein